MKRTDDRGDRDSGKVEIESHGFQVECFIRLPCSAAKLRDQRAQRLKTLASGALGRRIAEQQAQIRLQAALDRIVQRERQWRRRWGTCGHAAPKLSLLAV